MEEKVKSITEAFSMQPVTLKVTDRPLPFNPEDSIQRIDKVRIEQYEFAYEGYNFEGKKLFRYLEKSVNVHYK